MTSSETIYNSWLNSAARNASGNGLNLGNGAGDLIDAGRSLIPSLGWSSLPILAGAGLVIAGATVIAAIMFGPKWGVFYGNPPSGYAGTIIQAFLPTKVSRAKINPLDGGPFVKVVEINGKSTEVKDMENVWTSTGKYVGSFVNLDKYYVDAAGYVTKMDYIYNHETGEDDPVPEPKTGVEIDEEPRTKTFNLNHYLADNFAHYYLGNLWLLARAPKHEIVWYTRKGTVLVKRQEWERYIRVTEVDTAFDVTEKEPMLDKSGFPWWVQVTIIYKIRHLDKAWVSIPNSDDLMIRLVRGALMDWWQENAILIYEGQDLDASQKENPTPPPVEALKGVMVGTEENKDLAERFLEHMGRRLEPKPEIEIETEPKIGAGSEAKLVAQIGKPKMAGLCLEIMNKYGREITNIVIERKGLVGDYEQLLTGIKEAELKRRADIIRSQGRRVVMKNISEGMDYEIGVIEKGGEAARIAVLAGLFNDNENGQEPTNEDKLTTAFLFKEELKKGKPESNDHKVASNGGKKFHKSGRNQGGENK
ncbi:MAG: hypothetical protein L7H18_05795 [Candidatus Nealsonbacteria bacterium DGGOD1a]|nr:MAG: hypothetical protein L7H18_05795 [Candidatus Nealsonbacteria bacterium DGGOD1a]